MPNKFVTGPEIISGSYNGSFYRSNNKLCCSNCHNASLVPKIERESFCRQNREVGYTHDLMR